MTDTPAGQNGKAPVVISSEDLAYEEDILRNPYSMRCWLRFVEHKRKAVVPGSEGYLPAFRALCVVYERALQQLPGSYKLWYVYLKMRRKEEKKRPVTDSEYEQVNNCHERAIVFMHKMPRVWIDYCKFLTRQRLVTRTRKTFDRALRALPITQHAKLWPSYLKFIKSHEAPETAVRVYRRYLKLMPSEREEFVDYLKSINQLDYAAVELAKIVNDEKFTSKQNKSHYQLWNDLCELISKNPLQVKSLKAEPIIRQGIEKYSDQVGLLWCALAEYFIRAANFERARDIYEEAILTVTTVRDFTQVFDAYAQFEERVLAAKMEQASSQRQLSPELDLDIELRLARFESLMDRRPLLLNSVLLRQNPHNVHEWQKRVKLYEGRPEKVIGTYTEAVQTVDPKQATGRLCDLWVDFAKFYEHNQQLEDARTVFERALKVPYRRVDDLAAVWCEYAEMELRHDDVERAVRLLKRATAPPPQKTHYFDESESVDKRVYKSLKVWSLYADLEESFGSLESTKKVYDRIIDLRIATPQIIMNYALFLEESNYFEDAFKAYEKGIGLFKWPLVYDIWNTYLVKFVKRYGGKKLERARDLFEQCLEHCPADLCKGFYLMYAALEEQHGLARHAMSIYNRATRAVKPEHMYEIFNIYISKAGENYGVTQTRPIYEDAIERLPEADARELCLRFADLETKLGEVDRARAVYGHCSQMCDPRLQPDFWRVWKEFEVKHGSEDTVREMLRVKRSVQAAFNTQVNLMSALAATTVGQTDTPGALASGDSMAVLEARAQKMLQEEEAAQTASKMPLKTGTNISFVRGAQQQQPSDGKNTVTTANPDEINIDDMDDDDDSDNENGDNEEDEEKRKALDAGIQHDEKKRRKRVEVQQQVVPSEVFGGLVPDTQDD